MAPRLRSAVVLALLLALIWAGSAGPGAAQTACSGHTDDGSAFHVPLVIATTTAGCFQASLLGTDYDNVASYNFASDVRFAVYLPDVDPRPPPANLVKVIFSPAGGTSRSVISSATCPGGSVSGVGSSLVTVSLADGASCLLTVVSPNGAGGTLMSYAATLSRSLDVYTASAGTITGDHFGGTVTILVATQAIASTTLSVGTAAVPFTPVTAAGGVGTRSFAVSPALPAGLAFSTSTGQITGTPTAASPATTYTVTVTDQSAPTAQSVSRTFSLTVTGADMSVDLSGLPTTATVGTAYSGTVKCTNAATASAAATGATCSISGLPAGLAVGACSPAPPATVAAGASITCPVTGTPAAVGTSGISVTTGAGNDGNAANNTGSASFTVGKVVTTTTLTASASSVLIGQPVTLTAAVTPASATGSVTFSDGGTVLCGAVTLSGGTATCVASFTSAGTHAVTAAYGGSATVAASTSSAVSIAVTDQRARTVQVIGQFLGQRANQIMSNGPDLGRQIDRLVEAGSSGSEANGAGGAGLTGAGLSGGGSVSALGGPGPGARLGTGPDAGDIARLRLGGRSAPLADAIERHAARDGNPFPGPGVAAAAAHGPGASTEGGGGAFATAGVQVDANLEGAMRFAFTTSLRDINRAAADAEARRLAEAGLGFSGARGLRPAGRPSPFDLWVEGKYTSFHDGRASADLDGHFGLFTIGADYVLSRSLLVGTLVQLDSMQQRSASKASDVRGHGWLAGPYATLRLSENVFLQARGAWGQSSNSVSPFLTYTDNFETERWLASATLTGRWRSGPWSFRPSASVSYMEDTARSYADTYGVLIPTVRTSLGQARAGPEIGYRLELGSWVVEPRAGLQVIYTFAQETTAAGFGPIGSDGAGPEGARGRAEVGLRAMSADGLALDLSGSYDGIGTPGYSAMTGRAILRMPLN